MTNNPSPVNDSFLRKLLRRRDSLLKVLREYSCDHSIEAYQHPVHDAVRSLEEMCRRRINQNKLFPRACAMWFAMLWACRGRHIINPNWLQDESFPGVLMRRFYSMGDGDGRTNEVVTRFWRDALISELESWDENLVIKMVEKESVRFQESQS